MIYSAQNLTFSDQISMKFHCFSKTLSWTSFFSTFGRLGAKMLDFASSLGPSCAQTGARNRPSGAENLPISSVGCPPGAVFERTRFPNNSRGPRGHHFG